MPTPTGFATGRTRTLSVSLTSNLIFTDPFSSTGDAAAGGCSCSVRVTPHVMTTIPSSPPDGTHRSTTFWTVTWAIAWPGGSSTHTQTYSYDSGWISDALDAVITADTATGTIALTGSISGVERKVAAGDLQEWISAASASSTGSVTYSFTAQLQDGSGGGASTTYTGTLSDTNSGSASDVGVNSNYGRSLTLNANQLCGAISAAADFSAPGLDFSGQSFSLATGGATCSGNTGSATLTPSTVFNSTASATVSGTANWSANAVLALKDARDGSNITGWTGTLGINYVTAPAPEDLASAAESGGGVSLPYPLGGGYAQQWIASLSSPGFTTVTDGASSSAGFLVGTNFTTGHTGTLIAKVDETWADANGVFLSSGVYGSTNSKFFPLANSPVYDCGSMAVADTHDFGLFTPASWTPITFAGSTVTNDGGYWRYTPGDTTTPGQAETTVPLRPYAYRYYKIRVKADRAGATFMLKLDLGTVPTSGSFEFGWLITINAANTWEEKTIDLLFPNRLWDFSKVSSAQVRFVLHPQKFLDFGGTSKVHIIELTANTNLWLDTFVGELLPVSGSENRVRTALHYPLNTNAAAWGAASHNLLENPGPSPDAVACGGGNVMGRLLANAGILNLNQAGGATNNVREAQDALKTALDTTAKNTGITYTPAAPGSTTSALNGLLQTNAYQLPTGQAVPYTRPNDTPGSPQSVTFRAQERVVTMGGYYGMGDPAGSYGATIILRGERWLRGEAQALCWTDASALVTVGFSTVFQGNPAVQAGVPLSLRDNDTDGVIGNATSNKDGWARIPAPYGARYPYSNLPKSSSAWSTRQQFTKDGSGNVTSTTATGKLFNSFWLVSQGLVVKDGTNHALIAVASSFRTPFTVLDRLPCYYDVAALPVALDSPCCMHDKQGRFYAAFASGGGILVNRADWDVPPFTQGILATGDVTDTDPALYRDLYQRLHLLFVRGGDVLKTTSRDFGKHWSTPVTLFASADHPRGQRHPRSGICLEAAYRGGNIVGKITQPDGTVGAEFTFRDTAGTALSVEDVCFDLSPSPLGPQARWDLVARVGTDIKAWYSTDSGRHWTETV